MKKCILIPLLSLSISGFSQMTLEATLYSNPILLPSSSPMYFQTNQSSVIVIASPNVIASSISFPGIALNFGNPQNAVTLPVDNYVEYSKIVNQSFDIIKAKHNYIVGKTENDILTGRISNGCTMVARITVNAAKFWLLRTCPVAETPPTMVACAAGVALDNAIVSGLSQRIVKKGCTVGVKYLSKNLIELTIETSKDLENAAQEAKFWMAYLNSVDGMVWLMNNIK